MRASAVVKRQSILVGVRLRACERNSTSLFRATYQSTADRALVNRLAEDIYKVGKQRGGLTFGAIQDALSVDWFPGWISPTSARPVPSSSARVASTIPKRGAWKRRPFCASSSEVSTAGCQVLISLP